VKNINITPKLRAFIFDVDGTLYQKKILRRLIYKKMIINLLSNPIKTIEALVCVLSYRLALEKLRSMKLVDSTMK
jgi:beta-phosphoglucomutase-like phosphatase (HAD superfamily)